METQEDPQKKLWKILVFYLKMCLCIALLSPVPCLIDTAVQEKQDGALANIFTALFWLLHVVTEILLATSVIWTGKQIRNLLEAHEGIRPGEDKDKEKALKGLAFMMNQIIQSAVMNVALGLLVSFWPWLRNKSTYMLCFGTLSVPVLLVSAILILTPPRKQKQPPPASPAQKPHLITTTSLPPSPTTVDSRPLNPETVELVVHHTSIDQPALVDHTRIDDDKEEDLVENVEIVENPDTGEIELLSYSGDNSMIGTPSLLVRNTSTPDSP